MKFKTISCPVDFSDSSAVAVRYAAALSRDMESGLIINHVAPDLTSTLSYLDGSYLPDSNELLLSEATKEMRRFVARHIPPDTRVTEKVTIGSPVEMILNLVKEEAVDLLVMGAHGRTGYDRFLVGSVTNKVLHRSLIPVLVVCRPVRDFLETGDKYALRIHRILCPIDFQRGLEQLERSAISFAQMYGAEVVFLHVTDREQGLSWKDQKRASVERTIKPLLSQQGQNVQYRVLIQYGNVVTETAKVVTEEKVDLIIIGHHSQRPILEPVLGSVATRVVAESGAPVLVIRT
jgi:nucleotide-binding universal stress UspA family protein